MTAALQLLATLLGLLPLIFKTAISVVREIETGFQGVADATGNQTAGAGAQKLTLVQAGIQALYDAEQTLASAVPLNLLSSVVSKVVSAVVSAFNALGWFVKKSTPAPTA